MPVGWYRDNLKAISFENEHLRQQSTPDEGSIHNIVTSREILKQETVPIAQLPSSRNIAAALQATSGLRPMAVSSESTKPP